MSSLEKDDGEVYNSEFVCVVHHVNFLVMFYPGHFLHTVVSVLVNNNNVVCVPACVRVCCIPLR